MRQRLLIVLLLFALSAVTAFALPLLMSTASERTQQFVLNRTADLDRFAALPPEVAREEAERYTSLYGEEIVIVDAQGTAEFGMDALDVPRHIEAALRNQPASPVPTIFPWSTGDVLFARPIGTGTRVAGAIILRASTDAAATDVTRRWALVLAGAIAAAIVCVLLTLVVARWLLRPLKELERGVRAVAAGQRRTHVVDTEGPAELRSLSESFNRMSDAVSDAADQQRGFIEDASHQLRNPMAALRLRVDMLEGHDQVVAEVERLEALLDGMLQLATAENKATEVAAGGREPELADLGTVVHDRVDAWRLAAERAGVTLTIAPGTPSLVRCPESDLAQVLDVVLDNAIKYGGTHVTVTHDLARVTVTDDGPGMSTEDIAKATERFWRGTADKKGNGLGLAIADRLVTARGGTLTLRPAEPHGLTVELSLEREPTL